MKKPQTPLEWQAAMDAAQVLLALETGRQYGLIEMGPVVQVGRCERLMEEGKELGYVPRTLAIEQVIRGLADSLYQG